MSTSETDSANLSKKEQKKLVFFQRLKKKKTSRKNKDQNTVGERKPGGARKIGKPGHGLKQSNGKRKDADKQIYIGGLPYKMTEDDVRQMFASCGAIKSIHLPMNKQGKPAGFGFVTFESADSVPQALGLDGQEQDGRFIQVRHGSYEESDKSSREIIAATLQKQKSQQPNSSKKGKKAKKKSGAAAAGISTEAPNNAEDAPPSKEQQAAPKRVPAMESGEELFGNVDFDFGEKPGAQNPSRKAAKRVAPAIAAEAPPQPKKPKIVKF